MHQDEGDFEWGRFFPEEIVLNMDGIIGEELESVCLAGEMPFPRARDRYASRILEKKPRTHRIACLGSSQKSCISPFLGVLHLGLTSVIDNLDLLLLMGNGAGEIEAFSNFDRVWPDFSELLLG